jgi:two-component system cell cycle response regulator
MDLMVYLLSAFGYEVVTARDGRQGMETVQQKPVDLIICDLEMPEANGYEVAAKLKARPETRKIPLIAVTAYAMVGDRDKVLQAGFDGYLTKPIYPETFVTQIEAFLTPKKVAGKKPEDPHSASVTKKEKESHHRSGR